MFTSASRVVALLLATVPFLASAGCIPKAINAQSKGAKTADPGPGSYVFCFWNVNNLFDDEDDGRKGDGDKIYDKWFAEDPDILKKKLANLCQVLLSTDLNGGKGPDILALAEVESARAVELLQKALNSRLKDPKLHYTHVQYEAPKVAGVIRHIGTAVLTRLPVESGTQLLGERGRMRILESRVQVAGHSLIIISSHWKSRLKDKSGGDGAEQRMKYGEVIYGRFRQIYTREPKIDLLVCGDFNDDPSDPSVKDGLKATGDMKAVRIGDKEPTLFNAFARFQGTDEGTHYYRKWHVFDQICVSPGLLDKEKWTCNPASARIIAQMASQRSKWKPIAFGNRTFKGERGASDHFPVVLDLQVKR